MCVMETRSHWITSSAAPPVHCYCYSAALALLCPPMRSLLASKFQRASTLRGRVRSATGHVSRWSEGRRWRTRPRHGSTYAGTWGHSGKCNCLYSTPVTWSQVLQPLQALRRSLVAHVKPQRLMGLAVVHNRLLVAVEGQRAQLVRNLFVDRGENRGAWRKGRWRVMMWMQEGKKKGKQKKREKVSIRNRDLADTDFHRTFVDYYKEREL